MRDHRCRFDSFVAGPANQAALAAAITTAHEPGENGRLLVIQGGSGLGKTHLALAIVNEARAARPPRRAAYCCGYHVLEMRRRPARARPRAPLDLLVVDDLDTVAHEPYLRDPCGDVLEEAAATCRQVVVSTARMTASVRALLARCAPAEATTTVTLGPPDLTTRIRILERHARSEDIGLSTAVARLVARRITGSVRELEAALLRLGAHPMLGRGAITLALAEELLRQPPGRTMRPLRRHRTAFPLLPRPCHGQLGGLLVGIRELAEFIDDAGGGRMGPVDVRGPQDIRVPLVARDDQRYTLRMRVASYLAEPVSCDFVDEWGRNVRRAWPYPADHGPFRSPTFICTPPTAEFYQWHTDRTYRREEGTLANTVAAVYAALQAPEYAGRFDRPRRVS